jgi:hypothetical protein
MRVDPLSRQRREADERARQAAASEAERQRLEREAAAKREAEEKARQEERRKKEEDERRRDEAEAKRRSEEARAFAAAKHDDTVMAVNRLPTLTLRILRSRLLEHRSLFCRCRYIQGNMSLLAHDI